RGSWAFSSLPCCASASRASWAVPSHPSSAAGPSACAPPSRSPSSWRWPSRCGSLGARRPDVSLTGTLKDFSVTDVIQLIGQQSKSGVLHLRNDDGEEIHISFHQGAVVGADHVSRKQHDLLGSMLVRARLIDEHQLADALD